MHLIRKTSRYPKIYEANPVGPPISYEDFLKTAASLRGALDIVRLTFTQPSEKEMREAIKRIGRQMTEEIRRQWSVVTAMQYLTGQRADKALRHWAPTFEAVGLTRARVEALVAVANDFCANASPGRTLSSGLLVGEYKRRPLEPHVMLELLDLPADVIEQVKARAGS